MRHQDAVEVTRDDNKLESADGQEDYNDERDIPSIVRDVPHFFGDHASLHGRDVQVKGTETIAIPDGHDWLLASPRKGEDNVLASVPSQSGINAGKQELDTDSTHLLASSPLDLLAGLEDFGVDPDTDLLASPPAKSTPAKRRSSPSTSVDSSSHRGSIAPSISRTSTSGEDSDTGDVTPAVVDGQKTESIPVVQNMSRDMMTVEARRARGRQIRAEQKLKLQQERLNQQNTGSEQSDPELQQKHSPEVQQRSPKDGVHKSTAAPVSETALPENAQRRLEQVWADLRMPVMHKLDMAVKYTAAGENRELLLSEALPLWEQVAAAIHRREMALEMMSEVLTDSSMAEYSTVRQHISELCVCRCLIRRSRRRLTTRNSWRYTMICTRQMSANSVICAGN